LTIGWAPPNKPQRCLLHHAETVVIQGKSYRMKEKIEF